MANCNRKRFARTKICAGDLRHQIVIQKRELQGAGLENNEPNEMFTTVATMKCGITTFAGLFGGTALFSGVNIADRPTHVFTVRSNSIADALESGNNFILYDARYFRVINRTINNEDPYFVDIQAQERGIYTTSANEA